MPTVSDNSVNDLIVAALYPTYADGVGEMLMLWREANSLLTQGDYYAFISAASGYSDYTDAEYYYWLNFTSTPEFLLLEDGASFLLLEDGSSKVLLEAGN